MEEITNHKNSQQTHDRSEGKINLTFKSMLIHTAKYFLLRIQMDNVV